MKKIIAITGGIGSGKSLAATFLRQAGYNVVSCDEITAEMYNKRRVKKEIAKIFPSATSGKIFCRVDKKAVASQAFEDDGKRVRLNSFLHPLIIDKAIKRAKKGSGDLAFIEIPLLFESGAEDRFDGVIVIVRDKNMRIDSVKNRSGLNEEEILKRMEKQLDYDKADLDKYTVIKNGESKDDLKEKILSAAKIFL